MFQKLKSIFLKFGKDIVKVIISKWRNFKNSPMDTEVASVVTIVDSKNNFLIVKRGKSAHWHPNKWSLVGGFIRGGETPAEGARREVYEETTLPLPNLKYCFRRGNVFFFLCCLPYPHKYYSVALDFENDDYVWVPLAEIDSYNTTPECKNNILKCLHS
jgi:8-oxo-dGTP pyrophosphatase MutT (NUDIX family)